MPKLVVYPGGYALFWCPACNSAHSITVGDSPHDWEYNGDPEAPVTLPSIAVSRQGVALCHCYLEGAQIRFCADAPHSLAGQTVPLPDFPMERLHSPPPG